MDQTEPGGRPRERAPRDGIAGEGTRDGGRGRSRRKPRRRLRLLVAIVVVLLLASAAGALYLRSYFATGTPGRPVTVAIPAGASLQDIAALLEKAGVVRRASAFVIRVETDGYASKLKSGTYVLRANEPYRDLVDALLKGGEAATVRVTIPEGLTAGQMAALIAGRIPGFSAAVYRRLALTRPLPFRLPGFARGGSLEGFLFPATYEVPPSVTPRAVIARQLTAFRAALAGIDLTKARSKNLTAYDVVILASMIEREIQVPAERPLAAAVMWNRLHLGMPLQIDATIEYVLPEHKTQLTYQDLKIQSPYNTYLNRGLPPTPIANPGAAALQAAAHPAAVDYLYYVARGDGSGRHYFSSTYAQFLQDKARAQQP